MSYYFWLGREAEAVHVKERIETRQDWEASWYYRPRFDFQSRVDRHADRVHEILSRWVNGGDGN